MIRKALAYALAGAIEKNKAAIAAAIVAEVIAGGSELSSDLSGSIMDANFGALADLEKAKVVAGINQAIGNFCARMTTRIPIGIDSLVKTLRS